jgi:hypothetical protein
MPRVPLNPDYADQRRPLIKLFNQNVYSVDQYNRARESLWLNAAKHPKVAIHVSVLFLRDDPTSDLGSLLLKGLCGKIFQKPKKDRLLKGTDLCPALLCEKDIKVSKQHAALRHNENAAAADRSQGRTLGGALQRAD